MRARESYYVYGWRAWLCRCFGNKRIVRGSALQHDGSWKPMRAIVYTLGPWRYIAD